MSRASYAAAEHLRWYDYWLKGIDNGIIDEAPIYYYTLGAPEGSEWRSAWKWPLPEEKPTQYYFHEGKSKSVNSTLIFDLLPTSNIFDEGHRIRVTITCADKDNTLSPELSPLPKVTIYRNRRFASCIKLPIIPQAEEKVQSATKIIIVLVFVGIILAAALLSKLFKF